MNILFFDTETTGLPCNYRAPVSDLKNQPRIVQIAWLLCDASGNEIRTAEYIIKPNGFTIPIEASKIHGITTEISANKGVEFSVVLATFCRDLKDSIQLIAHNVSFDEKIVGAEFLRSGLPNYIETKPRKCTMLASTQHCAIPGKYDYKWPKLQELYMKLFGQSFEDAHSALADVKACAKCSFKLKQLGII